MNSEENNPYWFGFRQLSPPGTAVPCGPYRSYEETKKERERMKAWDAAVSVPFTAATQEDARTRAEELTGKI